MKKFIILCIVALSVTDLFADTDTGGLLSRVARQLQTTSFDATATFKVWLPNASDPVVYNISMLSAPAQDADSLLDYDYLIDWTLPLRQGESRGFAAYFSGNHYRYRDARFQEYHSLDNAEVFAPLGDSKRGVQRQAQFVDYLPGALAAELEAMLSDSAYCYKAEIRGDRLNISGKYTIDGNEVRDYDYSFDLGSGRPLRLDIETNPGQISEQTMTMEYSYDKPSAYSLPLSEDALMQLYPDEFAKYRSSDFRLENLPGNPLPEFSARRLGGDRLTYHKGEGFPSPTMLVFIDYETGNPQQLIRSLREAVSMYPGSLDYILAFLNNKEEEIEPLVGESPAGETVAYGARSAARDCGVTVTPTMLMIDSEGIVKSYAVGVNKNMDEEVLNLVKL